MRTRPAAQREEGSVTFLMKTSLWRFLLLLSFVFFALALSAGFGLAEEKAKYTTYWGKVVTVKKTVVSVQSEKGEVVHFTVGPKTVFIPQRQAAVGDKVKVEYKYEKGKNLIHRMKFGATPIPAKKEKSEKAEKSGKTE
jgi:hypothetical protein